MSARVYDQVETAEESIHSHLNDRELVALLLDRLQYDSGAADYYRARYDELNNRFEDRIYLLENSLRESQNDQLSMRWLISLGYMGSSSTAAQAIPVRVFPKQTLSIRVQQQLQSAIEALLEKFGFDVSLDLPGEFGSFWKRLWAKASGVVSQKEVVDRLKKIERSIETHHIDKPQAEANKANAESFSMIMNSLGNVDDACIQIGNILIVKHTPRGDVDSGGKLLVRTLSIQEMIALEEDQSLLKDPASILRRLQSVTVSRNEADTSRPMLSEVDKDTGT